MSVQFISDLHLCSERPAITALFIRYLDGMARQARQLYILGDLFESWVGDDILEDALGAEYQGIVAALRRLSDAGVPVFVMHGNRDFLLAEAFSRTTGCQLTDDPTIITLGERRLLLTHGDQLCTDDVEYQRFRLQMHDPQWQQQMLRLPLAQRLVIARQYRADSLAATSDKALEIMDVNPQAVAQFLRQHQAQHLIHGHTHRPGVHRFELDGVECRRYVLGPWYESGSVLVCDEDDCRLQSLQ